MNYVPGRPFYPGDEGAAELRVSFSFLPEEDLAIAVERLPASSPRKRALRRDPMSALSVKRPSTPSAKNCRISAIEVADRRSGSA